MESLQNTAIVQEIIAAWQQQSGVPAWGITPLAGLRLLPSRKAGLLPEQGCLLCFVLPYYAGDFPGRNVSLYALAEDYHTVAASLFAPLVEALSSRFLQNSFLLFSDSGPIPEVEAAVRAGLGVRGWHRQLITPQWGSLCFLAEIVTDLPLIPTTPLQETECEGCGACLAACPTGALTREGLCAGRCRSHITQKKQPLTEWEAQQIAEGGMAWGCDRCTLACPHNCDLPLTPIAALRQEIRPLLTEENCAELAAHRSYGWRGEAVLQRNLRLIKKKPQL